MLKRSWLIMLLVVLIAPTITSRAQDYNMHVPDYQQAYRVPLLNVSRNLRLREMGELPGQTPGKGRRSNTHRTAGTNSSGNPLTSESIGITTFTPVAASLIPEQMATNGTKDPAAREKMRAFFAQCLENYETKRKQQGLPIKDVALATSYFIGVNYMIHHGTEAVISERQGIALRAQLTEVLKADENFQALSDREKQKMYETMAVMGEFAIMGYDSANVAGNRKAMRYFQQFARENLEQLLGTSIDKLRFTDDGLEY